MKTSLSVLWRVVVVQLLFSLIAAIVLLNTALTQNPAYVQVKVSVLFTSLAAVLFVWQVLVRQSPYAMVFGRRLNLTPEFWKNLTFAMAAFYAALAVANRWVAESVSFQVWSLVKTFAPLPAVVLFILAIAPYLNRRQA
jgi:intracellular septation protein A